jgi:hypothetical protein
VAAAAARRRGAGNGLGLRVTVTRTVTRTAAAVELTVDSERCVERPTQAGSSLRVAADSDGDH